MADYNELASRIAAALDRIGQGVARLTPPERDTPERQADAGGGDEVAALREALEAERNANAQLEERVLAIKEKQEKVVARLEEEVTRLREEADMALAELQQLRSSNAQLRENNRALREANAAGLADPELINAGLAAELEALRGRREADRAELDAILGELRPMVEGRQSA